MVPASKNNLGSTSQFEEGGNFKKGKRNMGKYKRKKEKLMG
jgi:hypothetical protein